ncbi:MAG: molybdopterin-guanine dinucleotide biosynthesis protein A [Alphaproteobacteria bacterium]|nr:molybdopterin-guanine dinucleotide biosynthesis protein A [Alphaproteobacteria bacterium]
MKGMAILEKNMRFGLVCLVAVLSAAVLPGMGTVAEAADRHAGYYYPKPDSKETYTARASQLPEASRRSRIAFVTHVTNEMISKNPYPPQYAMFSKGAEAEKMIIVGLYGDSFNTRYRMRALLAMLTAVARGTPLFKEERVEDYFTFLDLCKMLGFKQLTVSDGRKFAHQIKIE